MKILLNKIFMDLSEILNLNIPYKKGLFFNYLEKKKNFFRY